LPKLREAGSRGQAGRRQVEGATAGLCQMIGAGGVCAIHILKR